MGVDVFNIPPQTQCKSLKTTWFWKEGGALKESVTELDVEWTKLDQIKWRVDDRLEQRRIHAMVES